MVRRLKKGIGKYKEKLPFKYFNYLKVGHFDSKYPLPNLKENDDEEEPTYKENKKKIKKGNASNNKTFNKKTKFFSSKEDSNSTGESDDEDIEVLFMGIDTQNDVVENKNQENS